MKFNFDARFKWFVLDGSNLKRRVGQPNSATLDYADLETRFCGFLHNLQVEARKRGGELIVIVDGVST